MIIFLDARQRQYYSTRNYNIELIVYALYTSQKLLYKLRIHVLHGSKKLLFVRSITTGCFFLPTVACSLHF